MTRVPDYDIISEVLNMVTLSAGGYKWTVLIHESGLEGNKIGILYVYKLTTAFYSASPLQIM